jgi:hypothetical protein
VSWWAWKKRNPRRLAPRGVEKFLCSFPLRRDDTHYHHDAYQRRAGCIAQRIRVSHSGYRTVSDAFITR